MSAYCNYIEPSPWSVNKGQVEECRTRCVDKTTEAKSSVCVGGKCYYSLGIVNLCELSSWKTVWTAST